MKTWRWVSIAVLLGLILRCVPAWGSIFTHGYVNFASPDSYVIINRFWLVSWASGNALLEHFVVFIPLVLFVLTLVLVYFIGKEIFSPRAGIVAAFVFALLPGEYLGRSILGEIDYHAFEVFLTTGMILCIIYLFKILPTNADPFGRVIILQRYILLVFTGFLFRIYFGMWAGALLFLPIIMAFTIPINKWLGVSLIAVSLGLLAWGALHSGFSFATLSTTAEAQPGFTGIFPALHILLAGGLLFMKQGGKFRWPLFTWTLILIIATLIMRRFDYYLIVPMAILLGGATEKLHQDIIRPALVIIFLVFCLPGYMLPYKLPVPSPAWHIALDWVRGNTPQDALIVSWWDYGYWIKYLGQRKPYINPGQETESVQQVARWFLDGKVPEGLGQDVYMIIDSHMVDEFLPAMRVWAGATEINPPFISTLSNGVPRYEFEFYSNGIAIFKYIGGLN